MSLRFSPTRPIESVQKIGVSIQTPRCLSSEDIALLNEEASAADRWSVFVSYQNSDASKAARISETLQTSGVSVFRDKEVLQGGQRWWPELKKAIARCRYFVLLIGPTTHKSDWVMRELKYAIQKKITVIPVLAGGHLGSWTDVPGLDKYHALQMVGRRWSPFIDELVSSVRLRP
jgi:hypothetical protein